MDSKFLVSLITPFTRYSKWKLKIISSLKRQDIYDVSIGDDKESYEELHD